MIAVVLMLSVLAVTALPRLDGLLSWRDDGWRDQIVAALRQARTSAVSHRRLVCADIGTASVALTIASANGATACGVALRGLDGGTAAATSGGGAAASVAPAGTLYFQPSGRVSTDAAGSNTATRTITISGQSPIVVYGETGYVQ